MTAGVEPETFEFCIRTFYHYTNQADSSNLLSSSLFQSILNVRVADLLGVVALVPVVRS